MYLALYNQESGNPSNLPNVDDFPAIYKQYRIMENWQHEFMAEHYVNLIAQALQEIHPLLNDQIFIDSIISDYPDLTLAQFYTNIAYLGLNGTTGQTIYLNDQTNFENYGISYETAKVNSTNTPNCN